MSGTTRGLHGLSQVRVVGLALAASALFLAAACGSDPKASGDSAPRTPTPVATTTTDSSGSEAGRLTGSSIDVSYDDAEQAYREKRYSDALTMFAAYVENRPDSPTGHYMLGLAAWKSGELDRAKGALERSLELDPRNVKSLVNLGRVLLDQNQPKESRTRVTAALKIDSTSGEGYRLMGRVRAALNQPNEAIASYQIALSLDPTDVWSMNNLGLILVQQQRFLEALGPLARAVQLDSTMSVARNNLGIALEHTGYYALATAHYRAAITLDSGNTKSILSLARVDGRPEDPSLVPVDLVSIAENFDREVRTVQLTFRQPARPPQQ